MSTIEQPRRQNRAGRKGREKLVRLLLVVAGLLVVFLLGMAFAETLDDRPGRLVILATRRWPRSCAATRWPA